VVGVEKGSLDVLFLYVGAEARDSGVIYLARGMDPRHRVEG